MQKRKFGKQKVEIPIKSTNCKSRKQKSTHRSKFGKWQADIKIHNRKLKSSKLKNRKVEQLKIFQKSLSNFVSSHNQ